MIWIKPASRCTIESAIPARTRPATMATTSHSAALRQIDRLQGTKGPGSGGSGRDLGLPSCSLPAAGDL